MAYDFLDAYEKSWDALYKQKGFVLRHSIDPIIPLVSRTLDKKGIRSILSMPCGEFTNELHLMQQGIHVDGIDISPRALELAEEKCRKAGLSNYSLGQGSVFDMTENNRQAILCIDFFVQFPYSKIKEILRKFHTILIPGGMLFANFCDPSDSTFGVGKVIGRNEFLLPNGIMMKYTTKQKAEQLVINAGFHLRTAKKYTNKEKSHNSFRKGATNQSGEPYQEPAHTHVKHFMILEKAEP
ncbi:MAG: class I SAM-dependent methyltransferase [Candidatus Aenigmarchaeota archaeon]|nr:class I SAM-dependent methyltransferase [Candidatus Aenigmarchaeota archaeon]